MSQTITIDELRNPARKSGFAFVGVMHSGRRPKPFFAQVNNGGTSDDSRPSFVGPSRATAEEAAQDAADFLNGQPVARPYHTPSKRESAVAKAARFIGVPRPRKSTATKTASSQKEGPGCVYLIRVTGGYIKLGETRGNPMDRIADGQTWHVDELELLTVIKTEARLALESRLHQQFASLRVSPRELFDPEILEYFEYMTAVEVDGKIVPVAA